MSTRASFPLLATIVLPLLAQGQTDWTWSNPQEYPTGDIVIATFLLPINVDNPEHDLKVRIGNRDYRILCFRGLGVDCPGVDPDEPPRFGYRLVEGSSDAIDNVEHGEMMSKVYDYAFRYNALLLEFVSQHGDSLLRD